MLQRGSGLLNARQAVTSSAVTSSPGATNGTPGIGPEILRGGLPTASRILTARAGQQRLGNRAAGAPGRAEYAGPRAGPPFCPRRAASASRSSASASSQGLVMASTFGPQTISGSKPSARRYAAPPRRFAAKFCRCHAQKVRVRRQCVRAAAQYFCIFQIPHRRVKGIQPGAPRGKGGLSLLGQPPRAAV